MPAEPALPVWHRRALITSWLAGGAIFLRVVNAHYPILRWLFWTYLAIGLLAAGLALACLAVGHLALARLAPASLPTRERLVLSFALGVLIFALGMFVAGLSHALGAAWFWLWPTACALAGGPSLLRDLSRVRRALRALAARPGRVAPGPRALHLAIAAFGALGVFLLWINILTPKNAGYDARWYHYALAEHYVAAGAITRFPEGFFGAAWPHLASWLYTWAFLAPGGLFFHMELAAHVELVIFLATLAGIPVLVRWMLDGRRAPLAGAAVFLFPGILLYDSSLCGGADHVLALWALALLLASRRAWQRLEPRGAVLVACFAAAAALTKYQAIAPLAFPTLAFAAVAIRTRRAREGQGGAAAAVGLATLVFVVVTAPHWLKNLVFYGDPAYPLLRGLLHDRPWAPGALAGYDPSAWRPGGSIAGALVAAVKASLTFSFVPHDWTNLHRDVPVFGSLFTLSLPSLIFLPGATRLRLCAGAALVGVAVWFLTFHQDRYLQALLPWMAAVVAAVLVRLWRAGGAVRATAVAAVALQIVWGGDVYAFPTHAILWRAPAHATLDLLSSGFRGEWDRRFATDNELEVLAPTLPRGSKLLIHETEMRLGSGVQVVTDARGAQGGIDYATLGTPRSIWDLLRGFGVTHLAWRLGVRTRSEARLSDEVAFTAFLASASVDEREFGRLRLARLSDRPPPPSRPRVAASLCDRQVAVPLERLDALAADRRPASLQKAPPAPDSEVWLVDESCGGDHPATLPAGYREVGRFPPFLIGVRR